tara:strand:+ start:334 stop:864 length:531 start_codon:yes stop_codon:yes gene_type:complete
MDNDGCRSQKNDDMELVKVTLAYCPQEDRVRMDGLGSTAGTIRIWFTARLLSLLARHLLKYEQQMGSLALPIHEGQPNTLKSGDNKEGAVVLEQDSPEVLISAVDVKTSADNYVELTYKDSQGTENARLRLTLHSLEKWLGSLKRCFETAQWSLEPFLESKNNLELAKPSEKLTIH